MKKRIILAFLFLGPGILALAQKQVKYFYDENWIGLKSDSGASYYRIFQVDECGKPIGKVYDYYITGELQAEMEGAITIDQTIDKNSKFIGKTTGYYKSKNRYFENIRDSNNIILSGKGWYESGNLEWTTIRDGNLETVTYYYESGEKSQELRYKNNELHGSCFEFYPDGNIKNKSEYINGVLAERKFIQCDEFSRCKKVFFDALTSERNLNNWDIKKTNEFKSIILEDTGYYIVNYINQGVSSKIYMPIDISTDFSIEANVTFCDGDSSNFHGIQYAYLDWENYSYFYISALGEYKIGHIIDGLKYGGAIIKSAYLNPGKAQNILKLSMYNGKMQYAVNGEIIFSEPFVSFKGNGVGFTVGGNSAALFKNFIIKETIGITSELTSLNTGWKGNGSGFFIDSNGVIATNYHVVRNAKQIEICFLLKGEKKTYNAKVISSDKINDLAILKIDDSAFKPLNKLPYGFKNNTSDVGSSVFTLGYPMALNLMGEEVKFTDGKLSARSGFQGEINTYQTSVAVQPGNSGGPLFDSRGNIIGIINSKLTSGDNVSYAVKTSYLNALAETLPFKIELADEKLSSKRSLVEKIKAVSDYVVLIKTK